MVVPATEIVSLIVGAVIGAYVQSGREKVKRIRNQVCSEMADEIMSARISGDVDHEGGWTKWSDVDDIVKRELPDGLRKEFNRYFQQLADLNEQKTRLANKNRALGSAFRGKTDLIDWEEDDLRVATGIYNMPETGESKIRYGADFEEWVLEFGPEISKELDGMEEDETLYPEKFEKIIRSHKAHNFEFQNIGETWNEIHGGDGWGLIIENLYGNALSDDYKLHVMLLENNKRDIKRTANEIDEWFTVIAKISLYFPYWIKIRKWLHEIYVDKIAPRIRNIRSDDGMMADLEDYSLDDLSDLR